MTNVKLVLHNNLKTVRAQQKFSQAKLAEKVGVSRQTISNIETGEFVPTARLALLLCLALDKNSKIYFIFKKISIVIN